MIFALSNKILLDYVITYILRIKYKLTTIDKQYQKSNGIIKVNREYYL